MRIEHPAVKYHREQCRRSTKPRTYTAESLLQSYKKGNRCFDYARLDGEVFCLSDLRGASFRNASLRYVNLGWTLLNGADFSGADLTGASLRDACVHDCNFIHAKLDDACLYQTFFLRPCFTKASLRNADVKFASLRYAEFSHTDLEGARMTGVKLDGTIFHDTDISPLCAAKRVAHYSPSSIDPRTIMRSWTHPRLPAFLAACGVPKMFTSSMIKCAQSIGEPLLHKMMQSIFISYGAPDALFALRVYESLRAHGVTAFIFQEDARPGTRLTHEIFDQIQRHDRILLVCSKRSLTRPGVLNEIRETLDREARDAGASYLLPIMLDDYVLTEWRTVEPSLAERVGSRVIADFRHARSDRAAFDKAMNRVIDALKVRSPAH